LGERHPDTARSFDSVSVDYSRLGDYKRALEYSEKALEIRLELLGDKHPDTIFSVIRLVNLLAKLNRRPEAFQLLEKYLPRLSKDHIYYDELKRLEQIFLAKPIRPGFRQPSSKPQGRSKKKRKKKR
jgi:tetratricopeptide (TPR) repeat protein